MSKREGLSIQMSVSELEIALRRAAGVVSKKSTLAEVEGVLIEAKITQEGGRVTVSATDLYMGIESSHPCEVMNPGVVCLPHGVLSALTAKLPENVVIIEGKKKNRVDVNSGTMRADLAGNDPAKFPALTPPGDGKWIPIQAAVLSSLIDQTLPAVCREVSQKQEFQGIHFAALDGEITAQATDLRRASRATIKADGLVGEFSAILPERASAALRRVIEDTSSETPGSVLFAKDSISYKRDGLMLTMRPIAGEFPDLKNVIPDVDPLFKMNRARLTETVARLATIGKDDGYLKIVLTACEKKLTASVEDGDRNIATEDLVIDYAGLSVSVRVGTKAMIETLKTCTTELISLWWMERPKDSDDRIEPLVIRPDNQDSVHLLMPFVN